MPSSKPSKGAIGMTARAFVKIELVGAHFPEMAAEALIDAAYNLTFDCAAEYEGKAMWAGPLSSLEEVLQRWRQSTNRLRVD
jgi:hypothetical protein